MTPYSLLRGCPPPGRTSAIPVLAVLLSLLGTGLLTSPAAARVVDPWPRYQPQTTCSPTAKPGTLELAAHLMRRYPGSGSSGISRACSAGGVSEHKEGRAFDWRVDVRVKRERRYAADFLSRLRRTDRHGNRAALARSMGVMYVIWDDHIYSSTNGYRERDYVHYACSSARSCSSTLQHRDHMHISLTWDGARARTRWYDAHQPDRTAQPDRPAPDRERPDRERPDRDRPDRDRPGRDREWKDDPVWEDQPVWQDHPVWEGHPVFGDPSEGKQHPHADGHPVWGDGGPPGHGKRH